MCGDRGLQATWLIYHVLFRRLYLLWAWQLEAAGVFWLRRMLCLRWSGPGLRMLEELRVRSSIVQVQSLRAMALGREWR